MIFLNAVEAVLTPETKEFITSLAASLASYFAPVFFVLGSLFAIFLYLFVDLALPVLIKDFKKRLKESESISNSEKEKKE